LRVCLHGYSCRFSACQPYPELKLGAAQAKALPADLINPRASAPHDTMTSRFYWTGALQRIGVRCRRRGFRDEPPRCCSLPNRSERRIRSISDFPSAMTLTSPITSRKDNASDSDVDTFFPFAAARSVKKPKQMFNIRGIPRIWKNGARTLGAKFEEFLENGGSAQI